MLRISTSNRKQHINMIVVSCLLALTIFSTTGWAASLQALRASGALGESYTGYVVARKSSAQTNADAINRERKAVYTEKAATQGVSVEQVGMVYAQEILKKLPKGTWILNSSGQWQQK